MAPTKLPCSFSSIEKRLVIRYLISLSEELISSPSVSNHAAKNTRLHPETGLNTRVWKVKVFVKASLIKFSIVQEPIAKSRHPEAVR